MYFANIRYGLLFLFIFIAGLMLLLAGFLLRKKVIKSLSERNSYLTSDINFIFYNLKAVFIILVLFFVIFSMLDPRWGNKTQKLTLEGIDIVLVFDVSRSMLTKDVLPDRLGSAKNLASKILANLKGNRVGVTAFAGYAFNVLPLTTDIDAVNSFVSELSTEMIDLQGTNLEDAIKKALELFDFSELTHKAIVIITDGEDLEFSPLKQVKEAVEKGVKIFTVGIGTPAGGTIPLYDENGNIVDYLKKDNKVVVSKLNEKLLQEISTKTGGEFIYGNYGNISLLIRRLDEIKKSKFGTGIYEFLEPQFQYFLFIAVLLLFIYLFLPEKRINLFKIFGIVIIFSIFNYDNVFASFKTRGVQEYRKGNYEKALELFQKALIKEKNNGKLFFNQGNTYFKLNKFDEAEISFERNLKSKDERLKLKSYYNLGNTLLERGDFSRAIESYRYILENENPNTDLFKKSLLNFLYAKQQIENNTNNQNQNQNQEQNQKNKNDNKNSQKNQSSSSSSSQSQSIENQPKQYSPTDVENLLNLIKEEEKKHIGKKEKAKVLNAYPQNEW
ncbi:MAG: VWA domain-containing protein [Brevinematia bacterium]